MRVKGGGWEEGSSLRLKAEAIAGVAYYGRDTPNVTQQLGQL